MGRRGALNLTPRQELYLRGRCRGQTGKETAAQEFVSLQTVKNLLTVVYRELRVGSAEEACYKLGRADQYRRDRAL